MRILGVDFGGKRIGIAVGESEAAISTPRPAIEASGTLRKDAVQLSELVKREQADLLVLGLPLLEDGQDSKLSKVIRKLGEELRVLQVEVAYVDEAFSSVQATAQLREYDWTAATRRKHLDSQAACEILERYFRGGAI